MFSGRLNNKFHGTSKKNGKDFFIVNILVEQNGRRIEFKSFIEPELFSKVDNIPLDSNVIVKSGVNEFGKLTVTDITVNK